MSQPEPDKAASGPGRQTASEYAIKSYTGCMDKAIHVLLGLLALLTLAVAGIAMYEMLVRDLPLLFHHPDQYRIVAQLIQNILLIAIAAELGLLLLHHRTSDAIEVIILVIARKIVNPEISSLELLLSVIALGGLIVVRYYFLRGQPGQVLSMKV